MNQVKGDIIGLAEEGHFDYIIHGCNCFHTMGSGIAGQLARKYPVVLEADKQTVYGDATKIGTWSTAKILSSKTQFNVINAYTQVLFDLGTDVFEYAGFSKFLNDFGEFLENSYKMNYSSRKFRVAFPKIGAGLAGGNWERIFSMIKSFAETGKDYLDVTFVEYEQ
jgi:O-acetyl-ADP-ribose deacetylase (regulator of RNase III)